MINDHRSITYWICFVCGDGSQFNDKEAFVHHLKSRHAATILPDQIPAFIELCQKDTPAETPGCPLCDWPEEGVQVDKDALLNHIAKDIHSFSLRALPWADNNGQEGDDRIHDSSEKVYKWLIDNELQADPGIERPAREKRIWHSEYFQQDAYFAGSSHALSSSQSAFDSSRENELEKLRNEEESIIYENPDASELESKGQQTENELDHETGDAETDLEQYTVGWACALKCEFVAAQLFLDERYERPSNIPPQDTNVYAVGKMGRHNIVIAALPMGDYGTASIANVSIHMTQCFPNIRIALMVGIGGGAPSLENDIRLGDVVVGTSGVLNYDFGKSTIQHIGIKPTGFMSEPPIILRNAISGVAAGYARKGHWIKEDITKLLQSSRRHKKEYGRPDLPTDRLYKNDVIHDCDKVGPCEVTCGDDPSSLVIRSDRSERENDPKIHYGSIASADTLMKNAKMRDEFMTNHNVLCFENEAAGLVSHFPCLVIRGICDYADSHKSKEWQGYAAMTAAAYAKDLLNRLPPDRVIQIPKTISILNEKNRDRHENINIGFRAINSGAAIEQDKGQIIIS